MTRPPPREGEGGAEQAGARRSRHDGITSLQLYTVPVQRRDAR